MFPSYVFSELVFVRKGGEAVISGAFEHISALGMLAVEVTVEMVFPFECFFALLACEGALFFVN